MGKDNLFELLSKIGSTETSDKLSKSLEILFPDVSQMPKFELPEFKISPYEETVQYKLKQEHMEKISETNKILSKNNSQLEKSIDIQKEQLDELKKQNTIQKEQLERETKEKEKLAKAEKRNKPWSIAGKILSGIIGLIAFVVTIYISLYPDKSKELVEVVIEILKKQI